ncbi:MAG: restriction endonuclease subunit S [Tissierellia bacterium]|nr:restriction endonuclease subunit S [Tissierellia bacterium]
MEWIELGELSNIETGKLNANAAVDDGKYPFFTCADEISRIDNYKYDKECILIAGNGNLNVKYYSGKFNAYQRTYIIESKDKYFLNTMYLYYFMNTYMERLRQLSIGGVIKYIKLEHLQKAKIPVPSMEIQKKIVEVLDKAQGLIDKRKEQIEALDKLTESIFYDMFGDPVIEDKGWKKGTIRDLTQKTQYGTSKKASDKGEYPILRMGNITYNGNWNLSDMKYIDLDENEKEKFLVESGDLLFNRTNSKELVGKTAIYREKYPMAFAGYLIKLIPNKNGNTEYISAYLNSKFGKLTLLNMAKNIVGMANINAQELQNIEIPIPPISLQNEFADKVELIEREKEILNKSLKLLEENYKSIMDRAFRGEIFS